MTTHSQSFDEDADPVRTDTDVSRVLMQRAVTLVGSRAEVARRLEVAPSHVSRACKGTVGLGVEACIHLAEVLDEDPMTVLRACGHGRLCDMLDVLRQGRVPRTGERRQAALLRLPAADQRLVHRLIDRLSADDTEMRVVASRKRGVR